MMVLWEEDVSQDAKMPEMTENSRGWVELLRARQHTFLGREYFWKPHLAIHAIFPSLSLTHRETLVVHIESDVIQLPYINKHTQLVLHITMVSENVLVAFFYLIWVWSEGDTNTGYLKASNFEAALPGHTIWLSDRERFLQEEIASKSLIYVSRIMLCSRFSLWITQTA